MDGSIRVLFVGDPERDSEPASLERADDRLSVRTADTASDGLDALADGDIDCVVSEFDLAETDGLAFLGRVRRRDDRIPFVLYAGSGSERIASDAIAAGVTDYLPKSEAGDRFEVADRIVDAVERVRARTPDGSPADSERTPSESAASESAAEDAVAELEARQRALRDAYEIITDPDRSFRRQVDDLLELGRDVIGTDYATFSRVDQDRRTYTFEQLAVPEDVGLDAGESVPLAVVPNCARVAETEQTLVLQDVAAEAPELIDPELGISSYLGAPVTVEGEVYGTFCFYDVEARSEPFTDWEETYVDLLGNWCEYELRNRRTTARLEALDSLNRIARDINSALVEQSSREEVERVVCRQLTDSDSYEFAWMGALDDRTGEVVPSAVPDGRVSIDDASLSVGGSRSGETPAARALRTDEPQVVRDVEGTADAEAVREAAGGREVTAVATIPVSYEHREYGVLNVYAARTNAFEGEERTVVRQFGDIVGIAIAALEHEHELAHERERLEFVNRLVRHNLLNSLNVVEARTEMLEDHVEPEASPHLETVRSRTAGMVDLIETLRSLLTVLVESEEPELEAVDLDRILREEVEHVQQVFDRVEFEVAGDLQAGTVMADDLLEELFENLLSNAIQHNDKRVPRIELDVEREDDMTKVHVADNGPGIPEEVRDTIFQKGEKGFESPGTGFGLYLVREIVEGYGGTVSVENNDPEGTVFSVSLPTGREAPRMSAGGTGTDGNDEETE